MEKFLNTEGKYGKYIMQELVLPEEKATPEAVAAYEANGRKRIHWLDGDNMPGCWQLNSSWYLETDKAAKPDDPNKELKTHVHDVDEILCFTGSDPENPYDLGGVLELIIGDERHVLTKSTLIFIPAGLPHSEPCLVKVTRPIFHFSTVLSKTYEAKK